MLKKANKMQELLEYQRKRHETQWLHIPLSGGAAQAAAGQRDYSPLSSPPYTASREIQHLATIPAIKQRLFMQPKHLK